MDKPTHSEYIERCLFQETLDRAFPRGALCAVLDLVDGHLQPTERPLATGRVWCSDARRHLLGGRWEFEILIDFRTSDAPDPDLEPLRLWIRDIVRTSSASDLWGADVVGEQNRVVRLNAEPPEGHAPTPRARRAVTDAYESDLFPHQASRAEGARR